MTTSNETQVASRIGVSRGQLSFASMAQDAKHPAKLELRKWLSANGVPSTHAARLSFAELENAWNDISDASLNILRLSQSATATTATTNAAKDIENMNTTNDVAAAAAMLAEALANQTC